MRLGAPIAGGLLSLATPALAQTLGRATGSPDVPWVRVVGALTICLLLALGAALALRGRLTGAVSRLSPTRRKMQVIETLRLSHQVDVCRLQCDDLEIVLAATPHGAVLISSRERSGTSEES